MVILMGLRSILPGSGGILVGSGAILVAKLSKLPKLTKIA